MSVRRFSPEPKPIHNHSTLERGLIPPTCPRDDRPEPPAHTDTHKHTVIDVQLCVLTYIACIKYENILSLDTDMLCAKVVLKSCFSVQAEVSGQMRV